ncbi:MAG: aspartate aminotransferase family protein [Polyangiaceae bacterium]|nr:aspartate aminotransferase family protein [Polyangiaceae bacterium]
MTAHFPENGQSRDEILSAIRDARSRDLKSDGHAFAFVYDPGAETRAVAREAFAACMEGNGLDPTVYPSARVLENALVHACLELLRAPAGAVGTATTGGTESVILAVKSARDHARKTRPHVTAPKMLLPETAHACFHKAAHYLGVGIIPVDVDPVTMRANVDDASAKMNGDVILVVGSAPGYAHGVVDPIEELAALAKEHGTLMHVDACVGGCVLPFLRDIGVHVPAFDFQVDGVTSMSVDLHKYGFAPKGVSVLLQRRRELRNAQYFACANWTGYSIVNSSILGSKSIAATAAALAIIRHLGRSGFRERAKKMWEATQHIVATIDRTPGIRLVARPHANVLALTTDDGDVFELADRLTECGWYVQPTYSFGRSPAHIHLTVDPGNADRAPDFARDLEKCAVDLPARMSPPPEVVAMLSHLVGSSGDGGFDAGDIMAQLGITNGQLPARAGMIHRILEAAPPPVREGLLAMFMGELFT